jgi:hypothetical protein
MNTTQERAGGNRDNTGSRGNFKTQDSLVGNLTGRTIRYHRQNKGGKNPKKVDFNQKILRVKQ